MGGGQDALTTLSSGSTHPLLELQTDVTPNAVKSLLRMREPATLYLHICIDRTCFYPGYVIA